MESADPPDSQGRAWLSAERGTLILLLAMIVALAALWFARRGGWRDESLPLAAAPAGAYANRIDPNTASWQSLACLPGIGEQKAQDIVAYRERHAAAGPAFRTPADLARIKGIKLKTVERIAPFLTFPADAEATQPDPPTSTMAE